MGCLFSTDSGAARSDRIVVDDISVSVVRKRIKHVHVRVYPPDGDVRVSAPLRTTTTEIRRAVSSRIAWIRRHRRRLRGLTYQERHSLLDGERHYVGGRAYTLAVVERAATPEIRLRDDDVLELCIRPGTDRDKREAILNEWYRGRLRTILPDMVATWERRAGVTVAEVRIKRMKTRWGTCNVGEQRIWLNLELAKRPVPCLEYVLVHEIVHLLERSHNARFYRLMDELLPDWRRYHEELNRVSLVRTAEPTLNAPIVAERRL